MVFPPEASMIFEKSQPPINNGGHTMSSLFKLYKICKVYWYRYNIMVPLLIVKERNKSETGTMWQHRIHGTETKTLAEIQNLISGQLRDWIWQNTWIWLPESMLIQRYKSSVCSFHSYLSTSQLSVWCQSILEILTIKVYSNVAVFFVADFELCIIFSVSFVDLSR